LFPNQLLDDAAFLLDLRDERRPALLCRAEHRVGHRQRQHEPVEVDDYVALTGETVVELHDDRTTTWATISDLRDRALDLSDGIQILRTLQHRHAGYPRHSS
jgi:hypothetical protein